ncbi:MAG: hypothetical protein R3F59_32500 [Myxococcota bacterium]
MGSGLVSFDDDPRRWRGYEDPEPVETNWTPRGRPAAPAPDRRADPRPHHGSNVAARIRPSAPPPPEYDEDPGGMSDGLLAMVAVAAGVSVVAIIGVGIVGVGVVAASLARPPMVVPGGVTVAPQSPAGLSAPSRVQLPPNAIGGGSARPVAATSQTARPGGGTWSQPAAPLAANPANTTNPANPAAAPPALAPAPAAADDGWMGGMLTAGKELVSKVVGSDPPAPPPSLATTVAPPGAAARPGATSDLLAGDDGLTDLTDDLAAERANGWTTDAAPDDAAVALLAELDLPSDRRAPPPPAPGLAAPQQAPPPQAAQAAPAAPLDLGEADGAGDGWFDAMLEAGSGPRQRHHLAAAPPPRRCPPPPARALARSRARRAGTGTPARPPTCSPATTACPTSAAPPTTPTASAPPPTPTTPRSPSWPSSTHPAPAGPPRWPRHRRPRRHRPHRRPGGARRRRA